MTLVKDQRETKFGARGTNELFNQGTLNDHAKTKSFLSQPNILEHQDSSADF